MIILYSLLIILLLTMVIYFSTFAESRTRNPRVSRIEHFSTGLRFHSVGEFYKIRQSNSELPRYQVYHVSVTQVELIDWDKRCLCRGLPKKREFLARRIVCEVS